MKQTARLAFIIALFFLGQLPLLSTAFNVHAQTTTTESTAMTKTVAQKDIRLLSQTVVYEVLSAISCQISGIDAVMRNRSCLTVDQTTKSYTFDTSTNTKAQPVGGLIGFLTNAIDATYVMPVHTSDYINHLASNFGIVKTAHAQTGTGFSQLSPVLSLWKNIRDLTYFGFVIIFVLIGAGIMLRLKIDPRTVMTIQNQIPKIVVGLLLITFSYAIVGFLIDALWLTTYFGINVLTHDVQCSTTSSADAAQIRTGVTDIATKNILNNPISYTTELFSDEEGCFGDWQGLPGMAIQAGKPVGNIVTKLISEIFGGDPSDWSCGLTSPGDCLKSIINMIFTPIAIVIIFVATVFMLFRVWFTLLKSYIYVLIYTMLAPAWIFIGLIPGSSQGFGTWLRGLIANLAVFPATACMLVAASIFATNPAINQGGAVVVLPLTGNPSAPGQMGALIAFGMMMLTPELINVLRNILKSKPSAYTAALFKGVGTGASAAGGLVGSVWNPLWAKDQQGNPRGALAYYTRRNITAPLVRTLFGGTQFGQATLARWGQTTQPAQQPQTGGQQGGGQQGGQGGGTPPQTPPQRGTQFWQARQRRQQNQAQQGGGQQGGGQQNQGGQNQGGNP